MVLNVVTDSVGNVAGAVTGVFRDPVIRLGVTGLSRAGKTVFITSLVANMLNRGRMPQLASAATGTLTSAYLQPQPDDTIARFAYEAHLDALLSPKPQWPNGTRGVSELRLSFRVQPSGMLGGLTGPKTVHL
ncbi:MAG: YcjX family protein, partial [Planktomarina sp.]